MNPTTAAGNKTLAEFMEWKYDDDLEEWREKEIEPNVDNWYKLELLEFHSSWSWIMPVWFKFTQEIRGYPETHKIMIAICDVNIELAFTRLVAGIEWYNTIKGK